MIDNRDAKFDRDDLESVSKVCDRKFGIGSDGLILIENHTQYDFEMVFYNPDGSQSLCGNGSRCAVKFAEALGLVSNTTQFLAYDGPHEAEIIGNTVKLKMGDVQNVSTIADGIFVDTGSPHLVQFVKEVDNFDVISSGRKLRYDESFKEKGGVNVNFVEVTSPSEIFVRTYERGVENETLSCGTGVTASAIASMSQKVSSPVRISTKGGQLSVEFKRTESGQYEDVYLIGPAVKVFEGEIDIADL